MHMSDNKTANLYIKTGSVTLASRSVALRASGWRVISDDVERARENAAC